jgi:hypothetical protein
MKKYLTLLILVFFPFFLGGCFKKFDCTIKVCDKKLFVERYRHRFIDVGYYYLTDSSNFRMFVGKIDDEHGGYYFICQGDSLKISETYEGDVINVRKYSLIDLRKGKEGFYF